MFSILATESASSAGWISMVVWLVILFAFMYFFMVRPQKKEQQQSVVDKANLMALRLTAGDTLLVNGKPMQVSQLKEETIRFVHRLGKKHLISIESDRDADYNLYFQMQNQLMEAYSQLRNETAQKKYHRDYALLNNDQKEQVRNICPQRITESYANAMTHADQRVDANAEEKQEIGRASCRERV